MNSILLIILFRHQRENMMKQLTEEKEAKKEAIALKNNPKMEKWIEDIKNNKCEPSATVRVPSVLTRTISKALWDNTTLISLDMSRCGITDDIGVAIAEMLEHNTTLQKLELANNKLGPNSCIAIGKALTINKTLINLNLEDNPLTITSTEEDDINGVRSLIKSLPDNHSLRILNMTNCRLGSESGSLLVEYFPKNDTLVTLDVINNRITIGDLQTITSHLEENKAKYEIYLSEKRKERRDNRNAEEKRKEELEKLRKQKEEEDWIEEQKKKRAEDRIIAKEEELKKIHEKLLADEEERIRLEEEKKKAEEDRKKRKKKKKKPKK